MGGAVLSETTVVVCPVLGTGDGSSMVEAGVLADEEGRAEASLEVEGREEVFVDAVLDDGLGLRPFFALVLKGFATGARLMGPVLIATVLAGARFFVVGIVADETIPLDIAKNTSDVARRRNCIYCTPEGLTALSGWFDVSDWAGTGSFGWGPG
jgi:hypothetical protein